ncbi:hypothetical protein HDU86_005611 [Geranomyces michiganensis]|nr:hypothetical protein HDU86_005611 [Geranomyces michiganensis]
MRLENAVGNTQIPITAGRSDSDFKLSSAPPHQMTSSPLPSTWSPPLPAAAVHATIKVEHGSLAYTHIPNASADKPTILFIHASIADRTVWAPQLVHFSATHPVLAIDLRRCGDTQNDRTAPADARYTMSADVLTLLDHLQIPQAIVVGNSLGGALALNIAGDAPTRVIGVANICSFIFGLEGPEYDELESGTPEEKEAFGRELVATQANDYAALADIKVSIWADGCGQPKGRSGAVGEKMRAIIMRNYALHEQAGEPRVAPRWGSPSDLERKDEIRCPVLVMTTGYDTNATQAAGEWVVKNLPNTQHLHWPDAAHVPAMEKPAEFNAALDFWIAWVERQRVV